MRGGRGTRVGCVVVAGLLVVGSCSGTDVGVSNVTDATSGSASGASSTTGTSPTAADELIPLDPAVVTGTLANGLTYFIRANDRPGGKAELRLAVNAGSALEDDDQSAVAHFLEHMMFNGTEKYAKNELIDVLQRSGSGFGADINAYTSYDETVYQLSVSNTDDEVDQGLDILHQWLTAVTLDPVEVEAERGVVLDEYRSRELTADGRVFNAIEQAYLDGSDYAGRSPIGTEAAIEGMTSELLRRFFDAWYRPDNAAIVVVGDIDPVDIERRLDELFSDARPRGDSPPRPDLGWPGPAGPRAVVAADADLSTASVELALPAETSGDPGSSAALAASVTEQVAMRAIADRLRADVTRGDAPFNDAQPSSSGFVRPLDAPSVFLSANNDDVASATSSLLDEFARVLRFGLSDADVSRAVGEIRAQADATFEQRDTVQDQEYADGLVDHFLTGSPFATADRVHDELTAVLDALDADVVGRAVTARFQSVHPVLSLAAKDDVADLPDEATLERELAGLEDREVTDREAASDAADSLMDPPEPAERLDSGRIPGRPDFYIDPIGVTFDNGVKVILNPAPIVDDVVEIYAFSPGGFSVTAPEDAPAVWLMNEVNSESGFGDLDAVQVEQILGPSTVDVSPFPAQTKEIFRGSSSAGDLELAMQVINQYVTASNFDAAALQRAVDRNLGYVADPGADPDLAADIALNEARYGDDPRYRVVLTADELRAITTGQLERVWAERFGNAADFVFVFSGDLDVDTTLDLAARYLGTLPSSGAQEVAVDVAPPVPVGIVTREVHAGSGDTAQLLVQYTVPSTGTADERIDADLLTVLLTNRLTARIREELGASYSPSAAVQVDPGPPSEVYVGLRISGAPGDMARIAQVLQDDLATLRADGPSADEMKKAIAEVKEQYGLIDNGEIIDTLERWMTLDDHAIEDYADAYTDVEAVTADEMRTFARRVLPAGQYIQVTQLPR